MNNNNIFKVLFTFKLPAIMFYVFILDSNYLPLYSVYLAKVGYKE